MRRCHDRPLATSAVSLQGAFTLQLDTAAGYLRVAGTGVSLVVAGQRLFGDFAVEKSGSTVKITIANGSLSLGELMG